LQAWLADMTSMGERLQDFLSRHRAAVWDFLSPLGDE
jgi:hypothetical protein